MSTPPNPPPPPLVPPTGGGPAGSPAPMSWEAQYAAVTTPPVSPSTDPARRAGTALGWAIGAAVASGLALVVAVVAFVVAVGSGPAMGGGGLIEPLRGQVVGLPDGAALSGDRLERVLVDLEREWGAEDVRITCPETASVRVSTVIVCRGDIDGYEWTGAVLFEDSVGSFVVAEF